MVIAPAGWGYACITEFIVSAWCTHASTRSLWGCFPALFSFSRTGAVPVVRGGEHRAPVISLGKDDYLSCECQAGTETNLQGELAGEFRVLLE